MFGCLVFGIREGHTPPQQETTDQEFHDPCLIFRVAAGQYFRSAGRACDDGSLRVFRQFDPVDALSGPASVEIQIRMFKSNEPLVVHVVRHMALANSRELFLRKPLAIGKRRRIGDLGELQRSSFPRMPVLPLFVKQFSKW